MPIYKTKDMFQFIHDAQKIRNVAHSLINADRRELKHIKDKKLRKHLYKDIDKFNKILKYTKFARKYVPIKDRITKYGFLLQKEKFV
jgi:hypothetical protein